MPPRLNTKMLRMALVENNADPADAIQTAYEWQTGGGSALYAFSSNGAVFHDEAERSKLVQEVDQCMAYVQGNTKAIDNGEYPEYAEDADDAKAEGITTSAYQLKRLQNLKDIASQAPVVKEASLKSGKKTAAAPWTPNDIHGTKDHAKHDLTLFLENTWEMQGQKRTIVDNLVKKMEKGLYDPNLAWRLWLYWVEAGAMRYAKEQGGVWFQLFPLDLRREVAKELAKDEEAEIQAMADKKKVAGASDEATVMPEPRHGQEPTGAPIAPGADSPAPGGSPHATTMASAKPVVADWKTDTLRAFMLLARQYRRQLKQVLDAKGAPALQQVLVQKVPGSENVAPQLTPAFIQWLDGQADDNTFTAMVEGVFNKRASWSSEEALHLASGYLRLAGFAPAEINSKTGNHVDVVGLNVNPHVLKHTAKLASSYGLKVRLVAAPVMPSAAGNHAGPANPTDPTGAPAAGTPAPAAAPAAAPANPVHYFGSPAPATAQAPVPTMAPPAPVPPVPAPGAPPVQAPLGAGPNPAPGATATPPPVPGQPIQAADYNGMGTQPGTYPEPERHEPSEICRNVSVPPVVSPTEAATKTATGPLFYASLYRRENGKEMPPVTTRRSTSREGVMNTVERWKAEFLPDAQVYHGTEVSFIGEVMGDTAEFTTWTLNGQDWTEKQNGPAKAASKTAIGPWGGQGYAIRQQQLYGHPLQQNHSAFVKGYLDAALWSSTGDDGQPLDRKFSVRDFSPEALQAARSECAAFESQAGPMLEHMDDHLAGHNFWLNRNGHGSGFWDEDRIPAQVREPLSQLCHQFGETDLYVGDDGKLHFSNQHKFASKFAADGSLIGHIAEIESMLTAVQEIADKVVATGRLTGMDGIVSSTERLNVKVYEAMLAARTAKGEAQGAPAAPGKDEPEDEPTNQPGVALVKITAGDHGDPMDFKGTPTTMHMLGDEEESTATCPACGGEGGSMGSLGAKEHFRCKGCGIDFSRNKTASTRPLVIKDGDSYWGAGAFGPKRQAMRFDNPTEARSMLTYLKRASARIVRLKLAVDGDLTNESSPEVQAAGAAGASNEIQSQGGPPVQTRVDQDGAVSIHNIANPAAPGMSSGDAARGGIANPLVPGYPGSIPGHEVEGNQITATKKQAEEHIAGPSGTDGDTTDAAIDFINANAKDMEDYSVQQLREALTQAGFTQQVATDAISDLLGNDALLALGEPVKGFLGA